jgi:hypothetical protein
MENSENKNTMDHCRIKGMEAMLEAGYSIGTNVLPLLRKNVDAKFKHVTAETIEDVPDGFKGYIVFHNVETNKVKIYYEDGWDSSKHNEFPKELLGDIYG